MILFFGFVPVSAVKLGILNLFLNYCSAAKEGFQTKLFKTLVLTQTDIENPKKAIFWFTFIGPVSIAPITRKIKKKSKIYPMQVSLFNNAPPSYDSLVMTDFDIETKD